MKTIEEIRHSRLMELLASPDFPTVQALATKIDRSHAQVSQWKNRSKRKNKAGDVVGVSNIDSDSARWIEERLGKPRGWMDNDPAFEKLSVGESPAPGEPPRPDFHSRIVSDSEWALLEDLRVMPEHEIESLRERAAKNREHFEKLVARRQAAAAAHVRGQAFATALEVRRGDGNERQGALDLGNDAQ